jgi:AraC family transcriptional regulator
VQHFIAYQLRGLRQAVEQQGGRVFRMGPGETCAPRPAARTLVEPGAFPSVLSRPSQFDRILHAETGLCVSHHRYAGAEFRIDGFSHHCVTIQLAGRTHHRRQVGEHRGDGTAIVGNFFTTVAGRPIDWRWDRPAEVVNAWIAPGRLHESLAPDGGAIELLDRFCADDPLLAQIGLAFRSQAVEPRPFARLMIDGLVATLLAHLGQRHSSRAAPAQPLAAGGLSARRLKRVLDHIDMNIGGEIGIDELAALVEQGSFHFQRCFKQSTGLPPHRYIVERRVERACELLATTRLALIDIALACGFADQSHFGRVFRRHHAMTPMAYRRQTAP